MGNDFGLSADHCFFFFFFFYNLFLIIYMRFFFFIGEGLTNLGSRFKLSLKNMFYLLLDLKEDKRRKRVEEEKELDEKGEIIK